jgi:hypothetical protein
MTHRASVCLVATLVIAWTTVVSATAQQVERFPATPSLDAQFPSAHRYIVEVWFSKEDKPGTFRAKVYDPSIGGDYNRQAWEAFRTRMNDPEKGWESRVFEVTTREGVPQTEKDQVMARIRQEFDRIEFQKPKTVDVKPEKPKQEPKKEPKKGSGKTTFKYAEKAKKSADVGDLADTVWAGNPYPDSPNVKKGYYFTNEPAEDGNAGRALYRVNSWRPDGRMDTMNGGYSYVQDGRSVIIKTSEYAGKPHVKLAEATISEDGKTMEVTDSQNPSWKWVYRKQEQK